MKTMFIVSILLCLFKFFSQGEPCDGDTKDKLALSDFSSWWRSLEWVNGHSTRFGPQTQKITEASYIRRENPTLNQTAQTCWACSFVCTSLLWLLLLSRNWRGLGYAVEYKTTANNAEFFSSLQERIGYTLQAITKVKNKHVATFKIWI